MVSFCPFAYQIVQVLRNGISTISTCKENTKRMVVR
jgi:hypothetical protein